MATFARGRWVAVSIFLLSSAISSLDRQLLANLAPVIKHEFQLSNAHYGWLVAVFSILYGTSSPLVGIGIDRLGLSLGTMLALSAWSLAGAATGLTTTFAGLLWCRAMLGIAESGSIPATAKTYATYLPPIERPFGTASGQVAITLGSMGAAFVASSWLTVSYGWRASFVLTGLLGFLWIPLWAATARAYPPQAPEQPKRLSARAVLGDRRLWSLCAANLLIMVIYSLWTNWVVIFLVERHGLSPSVANRQFAAWPPLLAAAGGFFGGWLSYRWSGRLQNVRRARWRVCLLSAFCLLGTALVPLLPSPAWATLGICFSFFWVVAASVNVYAMPLELFGAERAASAVALLTASYGLLQTPFTLLTGYLADQKQWGPVCLIAAVLPLLGVWVLRRAGLHE